MSVVGMRPVCEPGPVHVKFVGNKMALEQVSLDYFCLALLGSFCQYSSSLSKLLG